MTQQILVPLDGSTLSHAALPLARGLAEQLGASVTFQAVITAPANMLLVSQEGSPSSYSRRDVDRLAGESARQEIYLANVAATFPNVVTHCEVRIGNAAEQIIELAESLSDPLIVMASHGRSGIGRALLGSVAMRVVQHSHCPVTIVRASGESGEEHGSVQTKTIVIPLDGSQLAEQVVPVVTRLFGTSANIHLLQVVEPIPPGQIYAPEVIVEYEREARQDAEAYLQSVAERLQAEGFAVSIEVRGDSPANGIADAADDQNASLIALSTHGRTGLQRFIIGSVAERVVREASKPVMVVRSTEPADS